MNNISSSSYINVRITEDALNDHKNRRFFKHSLEKIRDHLEITGWYEYPGKYFTSELGWPKNFSIEHGWIEDLNNDQKK